MQVSFREKNWFPSKRPISTSGNLLSYSILYKDFSVFTIEVHFMVNDMTGDTMAQRTERKKLRVGFILFAAYFVGYTTFTFAGTFARDILLIRLFGVNLGIVSGMAIIMSAILIAVFYNWYSGKVEAE